VRELRVFDVARRPRWIAALIATLAIAVGFVVLSQWQVSRAVEQATVVEVDTENSVALPTVATPQSAVTQAANGQLVTVEATLVAGDYSVISGRQQMGATVFWVTGHAVTTDGVSLAVALGWAPTDEGALQAATQLSSQPTQQATLLRGRYVVSEGATEDDFESGQRRTMSVATLINEWAEPTDAVYGGYLVLGDAPQPLATIDSPAPQSDVVLNWLNVFYAIEWVVFAGFAFYFWFRLVRDEWERELDELAVAAAKTPVAAELD
jgi:surfeit locus 1 family protein